MKIRVKIILFIALSIPMIAALAYSTTIVGSRHDISSTSVAGAEKCVFCHTPHFSNADLKPLWNKGTSTATFTPYSSPTMNTSPVTPNPASLVCFSCHDGVNASNKHQVLNAPGAGNFNGEADPNCVRCHFTTNNNLRLFGKNPTQPLNLNAHHPISNSYPTAIQDPLFNTPPDAQKGWSDVKLVNGVVECVSCHDPHDPGINPFLRKSNSGSALCLTCHIK